MDAALADLEDLIAWTRLLLDEPSGPLLANLSSRIRQRHEREDVPAAAIARAFDLTHAEQRLLWVLAAAELDDDLRRVLGDTTPGRLRKLLFGAGPSLAALDALAPTGALRRFALIERCDGGGPELHDSRQSWAISRRVLAWLHGERSLDPMLARLVRMPAPRPLDQVVQPPATIEAAREAMRARRAIVVATGAVGLGRRTLLAAAAHAQGISVLEIDARKLGKEPGELRSIARECRLLQRTPLVCHVDAQLEALGRELVTHLDGLVLVTTQSTTPRWDRPAIVIEVARPTSADTARVWKQALPEATEGDADHLATHYPLAPALIHHAGLAIRTRATDRKIRPEDVEAGIRAVLDDRLGELARRISVTQTWDDLVLPQEQLDSVHELCARIGQRRTVYEDWGFAAKVGKGLGTAALLSGPPGTGKTMVAGLVARELGLPLYQVDTARITSKYIGETEQHLAALFDAAEAAHAILLFDEADSMFAKRTEVRSSNDRYANLETNYLLQRLESFTGICLLTSNHEASIDPAFRRRLALHLHFDLPDAAERARLWRAMFPSGAPLAPEIDFDALATRFSLAGGHIRNAALRAAFLAADEGSAISPLHVERAAQLELESIGKIAA